MKYKAAYSSAAIRDLDRVWAEVLEASASYDITEKYLDDLLDTIEAKTDYPRSGIPLYYENAFTGYYYVVFKAYLVFYRIDHTTMLIDRVLYGKSDYMRVLGLGGE